MKFTEQLKLARGDRSQSQAAAILGCKVRTLQHWEQGRNPPDHWQRLALAGLLGHVDFKAVDKWVKKNS